MPKVKWIGGKKPKPVNHLAGVLRAYKLASGKTSEQIGQELGVTGSHVRQHIGRPADAWNVGDLKRYCDVLGCPYDEALAAAAK